MNNSMNRRAPRPRGHNPLFSRFTILVILTAAIAMLWSLAASNAQAATMDPDFLPKWNALGGAPGAPKDPVQTITGGKSQEFYNGRMFWNETAKTAYWVNGSTLTKYDELGAGLVGLPTDDIRNVLNVTGARQCSFQNGNIYWGSSTGAHFISGSILTRYLAGPGGGPVAYGLPAEDAAAAGSGWAQNMQKAIFFWDGTANPAHLVGGAIFTKYQALGGPAGAMGMPVTDEYDVAGVSGAREHDFAGGKIYWGPGTGAWSMSAGAIATKYEAGGGAAAFGLPISDQLDIAGGGKKYQKTERAIVTWNGAADPAFVVYGGIMYKYNILGGPTGHYGVAVSDETDAIGATGGRQSSFEAGRMYWSATTGTYGLQGTFLERFDNLGGPAVNGLPISDAYPVWGGYGQNMQKAYVTIEPGQSVGKLVHGGIFAKYQMLGGPGGALYLITAEERSIAVTGATGAVQADFQNGYVFWSLETGSHPVNGGIYTRYLSVGGAFGHLGLPITDEYSIDLPGGGRRQRFQHGFITWGAWYGTWADFT